MDRQYAPADTHTATCEIAAYLVASVREPRTARPVVGIDGRSGAGKTTFGHALARALGWPLLSTDDLVPGWDGLAASVERLTRWVLRPLAAGQPACWRRFDWSSGREGAWVAVPPGPGLVVEGCGVGTDPAAPLLSALVWLEVPYARRRHRLERRSDWPAYRPHAARWALQERAVHRGTATAGRADIVMEMPPDARGAPS